MKTSVNYENLWICILTQVNIHVFNNWSERKGDYISMLVFMCYLLLRPGVATYPKPDDLRE